MPGMIQPDRVVTWLSDSIVTVSVKSMFTQKINTMTLEITRDQWDEWQGGKYIQSAMPQLTPDQCEFLLTGATQEEWDEVWAEDGTSILSGFRHRTPHPNQGGNHD